MFIFVTSAARSKRPLGAKNKLAQAIAPVQQTMGPVDKCPEGMGEPGEQEDRDNRAHEMSKGRTCGQCGQKGSSRESP